MDGAIRIDICMGSSCFARGNKHILESVRTYLEESGHTRDVDIKGCLCQNECGSGPHITIDGIHYSGLDESAVIHKIKEMLSTIE